MRDYLKLYEIKDILDSWDIEPLVYRELMNDIKREAETCLCHAYSSSECLCGAWESDEDADDDNQ